MEKRQTQNDRAPIVVQQPQREKHTYFFRCDGRPLLCHFVKVLFATIGFSSAQMMEGGRYEWSLQHLCKARWRQTLEAQKEGISGR